MGLVVFVEYFVEFLWWDVQVFVDFFWDWFLYDFVWECVVFFVEVFFDVEGFGYVYYFFVDDYQFCFVDVYVGNGFDEFREVFEEVYVF